MKKSNVALADLFYEALASELGIAVKTNDPQNLRQQLYQARRAANDPDLDCISITIAKDELFLVKKPKEPEDEED